MKITLSLCFLLTSLIVNAKLPSFDKTKLIVKLKDGHQVPSIEGIKKVTHLFENLYVLDTEDAVTLENELLKSDSLIYSEKNFYSTRQFAKKNSMTKDQEQRWPWDPKLFDDKYISKLWAFDDSDGINVNSAYEKFGNKSESTTIVAVVDTGVDSDHGELVNVMWKNPGEIAGNGIDDDNNGYVDDVYGLNTLVRDAQGKATVDTSDSHGHGTHVSGTIGASQNNKLGIAGVASNVKIMAMRTVPNNGDEKDVDIVEAFLYAAKNGAKVINCSFGKKINEGGMAVSETIDYIGKKYGVLVVAAAGNDSSNIDIYPKYPASFANSNLLVVASTTKYGSLSFFSNHGKKGVDIAAPGSDIYSLFPGNKYASFSGTSMAAPHVAAVAAEVLSRYPELSVSELKNVLTSSVTPINSFSSKMLFAGRVDLARAIEQAQK